MSELTATERAHFELAIAALRQALGAFAEIRTDPSRCQAVISGALIAQWRRTLDAIEAGQTFYGGGRSEELRREFDALLPTVDAARKVAAGLRSGGLVELPPLDELRAAVDELDGRTDPTPARLHPLTAAATLFIRQMNTVQAMGATSSEDVEALGEAALAAGHAVATESELLTAAEHRAMDLTAELVTLMRTSIIAAGPASTADFREFVADMHHVQHRILKQAAARAYPDRYRLLGGWPDLEGINVP